MKYLLFLLVLLFSCKKDDYCGYKNIPNSKSFFYEKQQAEKDGYLIVIYKYYLNDTTELYEQYKCDYKSNWEYSNTLIYND